MEPDFMEEMIDTMARDERRSLPILRAGPKTCDGCGFCCQYYEQVDIFRDDPNYQFLIDRNFLEAGPEPDRPDRLKLDDNNRCIALTGTPGLDARCSIYENRPQVCRDYKAGGGSCRSLLILDKFKCLGDGHKLS